MKVAVAFGTVATVMCLFLRTEAERMLNRLIVRYSFIPEDTEASQFSIPTSTWSHDMAEYFKIRPDPDLPFPMDVFCLSGDPRFCPMYDKMGNSAGVQISFLEEDFSRYYNFSAAPNFKKAFIFNIPVYTFRMFFTNPETLTEAGRNDTTETAEGLWAYLNGKLVKIDRCLPNSPVMGDFYLQSCQQGLGTILTYGINRYSSCKGLFGLYLFYALGYLVGFGLGLPGYGSPGPTRDWYIRATGEQLKLFLPDRPRCLESFIPITNDRFTAVNVFMVDNPQKISCPRCHL